MVTDRGIMIEFLLELYCQQYGLERTRENEQLESYEKPNR